MDALAYLTRPRGLQKLKGRVRVLCAYASMPARDFLKRNRAQRIEAVKGPFLVQKFGGKTIRRPRIEGIGSFLLIFSFFLYVV